MKVTLPLHMKPMIVEQARLEAELDGVLKSGISKTEEAEILEPYIQKYAEEAYEHSLLAANPFTPRVADLDKMLPFYFGEDGLVNRGTARDQAARPNYRRQIKAAINHLSSIYAKLVTRLGPMRKPDITDTRAGRKTPQALRGWTMMGYPAKPKTATTSQLAEWKRRSKDAELNRFRYLTISLLIAKLMESIYKIPPEVIDTFIKKQLNWEKESWENLKQPEVRTNYVQTIVPMFERNFRPLQVQITNLFTKRSAGRTAASKGAFRPVRPKARREQPESE